MSTAKKISITENAAKRVAKLIAEEKVDNLMLRVMVSAGGCSGFEYRFDLEETKNQDDNIIEAKGIKLIVDNMSLELLDGSEVDYLDDLTGASFRLNIPNATASCGCGISFSI